MDGEDQQMRFLYMCAAAYAAAASVCAFYLIMEEEDDYSDSDTSSKEPSNADPTPKEPSMNGDLHGNAHLPCIPSQAPTTPASERSALLGRKRCRDEQRLEHVERLVEGMHNLAEAIKRGSVHWSERVAEIVMKMEDFDENVLARALDELVSKESLARSFIVKSPRLRHAWMKQFAENQMHNE